MWTTGLFHRSISSTAPGISDGIVDQQAALVGVVDQRQRAQRDQVAGGLVAGHQQQEREVEQVFVGEPVSVDLGVGQHRQQVVARFDAPGGDQLLEVLVELPHGDERVEFDLGVGGSGGRVRPRPELLPVVGRGADQLGDHPGGQRSGDLLGELVHGVGFDAVEDSAHDLADLRLEHGHPPPGEAGVDQLAQLPVPRRVGEDQVALLHRVSASPGPGW